MMKLMFISFLEFFMAISFPINAQKREMKILKKQIKSYLSQYTGLFAVAYQDLQSNQSLYINEKEIFHAASTIKTVVMVEVFNQARQGKFNLHDSLIIKNKFKSVVDSSLYELKPVDDSDQELYNRTGQKITISKLNYLMMTVSSNIATNMLIELTGTENIKKTLLKLKLTNIKLLRGVEDQKAFDKGIINTVTALDLLKLFKKIALNNFDDKKNSEEIIKILLDQKFNEIIPALLPEGVKVAHKTGSIKGVEHDSGIVYLPNGKKYVLILLSKNLKGAADGFKALSEVSKMIYEYLYKNKR